MLKKAKKIGLIRPEFLFSEQTSPLALLHTLLYEGHIKLFKRTSLLYSNRNSRFIVIAVLPKSIRQILCGSVRWYYTTLFKFFLSISIDKFIFCGLSPLDCHESVGIDLCSFRMVQGISAVSVNGLVIMNRPYSGNVHTM